MEKYKKGREFYTFNDKYDRDFIRKSIKEGRCGALNRYFESNQCEEILNTVKKPLKINDNEIPNKVEEYLIYIKVKREKNEFDFENGQKNYRLKKGWN